MFATDQFKRISIITGHYGSGKSNIAVNLALAMAKAGGPVTIVDLDIVNPYFRTADLKDMLEEKGIHVITPVYANTNLDIPALPPEISSVFRPDSGKVVIDVGGDDAGAIALGQFAGRIAASEYDMYYVINERRYLTRSAPEAAELLLEIEASSRVKATKLINNTNLGEDTSLAMIEASLPFGEAVSRLTGLPLAFTCADRRLAEKAANPEAYYPVDILVHQNWDV